MVIIPQIQLSIQKDLIKVNSRVLRGGSWDYDARILRSADRDGNYPDDRTLSSVFELPGIFNYT